MSHLAFAEQSGADWRGLPAGRNLQHVFAWTSSESVAAQLLANDQHSTGCDSLTAALTSVCTLVSLAGRLSCFFQSAGPSCCPSAGADRAAASVIA